MTSKLKYISLFFISIMLVACNFHLRGSIGADFDSISIYGGSEGLNKHLQKRFKQASIKVNEKDSERILEII